MQSKLIAWLVLAALLCSTIECKAYFVIRNNKIYDDNGGQRIFHGVNVVAKNPPYYDLSFGLKDILKLKKLGLNGIRLGVMWPGVQPRQNFFDDAYLKRMVDWVNMAGQHGIYTLIQFHQDLFSEKFCADGVPIWAIPRQVYDSFPLPVILKRGQFDKTTGLPSAQTCKKTWSDYYFSYAVNKAFGYLWKNKSGLLDKFATYWKKVAAAFKDNPYVIAYELINEPWPGDMYENPLVMLPGLSQSFHLQGAYDFLSQQIRKVDPDHNICYQPVTWLNALSAGFTHPPGGSKYANSSIFCYHYYNPPTFDLNGFMNARLRDIQKLGGAGLLSQFYIIDQQGPKNIPMMDKCDEFSQSWFGWIYNPNRQLEPYVKRTFAHRVAGTIKRQSFDHKTKQYTLTYTPNPNAGITRIYFDASEDYKNNFVVRIQPTQYEASYQIVDNIYLEVDSGQFEEGTTVMIGITQ